MCPAPAARRSPTSRLHSRKDLKHIAAAVAEPIQAAAQGIALPLRPEQGEQAVAALALISGTRRHKNLGRRSYRKHGAKSSRTNRSTPAASNATANSMRLRPTHRDRRTRHGPAGKTVAHDTHPLDWARPGVVLRPPPVNPRPQRGQLDPALVREHGLRLSACAICFDYWLPLTARSMPSALPLHL